MQERSLGCWESSFRSAHDMLAGTMLVVCCAEIEADYHLEYLHKAAQQLFRAHPLLQAVIEVRGFNSYFVLKANFAEVPIQLASVENWQQQFEAEIHQPLETNKYLWRISVLPTVEGFKLFLVTHHAIADAISQVNLIEQFLTVYNALLMGLDYQLPEQPFLNNVEALLKEALTWEEFSKNYEVIAQADIDKIDYAEAADIKARKSHSVFISLERQQLQTLLNQCKAQQVTLNSLLNAVMLKTQADFNPSFSKACLKTPVNLRKYCKPEIEVQNIGCYLSIVETLHEIHNKDIWQLAAEYQKQLHDSIPKLGLLPRVIDYNEVDIALVTKLFAVGSARRRKHLPNTFGISNIGRLQIQTEFEKVKLKDFVFSANHLVGNYYMFLSALTLRDKLNLIFAYVTPLISEVKADKFIASYCENLKV